MPSQQGMEGTREGVKLELFQGFAAPSLPAQGPVPLQVALQGLESIFRRLITPCLFYLRDCLVSVWGQQATCLHPAAFMRISGSTFLILHRFLGKSLTASSA